MLSIIIVNYNQKNLLRQCLRNIDEVHIGIAYEIIIVDNNSTDSSKDFLSSLTNNKLLIINNSKNIGYAAANNQGIKLAKGKYILTLNPDVIVLRESIEKLFEFLEKNSDVAMIGPQLLNPDKSIQYSCCRFPKLYTPAIRRTFLGKLPVLKYELDRYLMLDADHTKIQEVDWLIGAVLMMRKSALDSIGLLDERFFLYFEDVDLARRIKKAGYKVMYYPKSKMYHFHQRLSDVQSGASLFSKITWIHIVSALKYFIKWRGN
ncbi:glycosyltransferase family 2 protein [Patescibacteria group bacterium AH-259-L07]|nr:glycosyltransferase family 2 protein [Patescibacteria group bacterium AH-259-L07]